MKFFQKKKNYSRLGKILITIIIICVIVIFPLGNRSTILVEYTESAQQSEIVVSRDKSKTANEDSKFEVDETLENEIDEYSELEVEEAYDIEVDEYSELEVEEAYDIEVNEYSELEVEKVSDIYVDEISKLEVDESSEIVNSHIINGVNGIYQFPELPTGCEATALTCIFNYWGINVDKVDLAMNYLPRAKLRYETDGIYGPNPFNTFAGDPSTELGSFGCFAPCLVRTFENYVSTHQELAEKYVAHDLSGQSFESILQEYVANDRPVLVIVSPYLREPKESITWKLEDGGTWTWQQGHHAMVVYGFDLESNEVYVADSAVVTGMATYPLNNVEEIYIKKGMSAMTILPK